MVWQKQFDGKFWLYPILEEIAHFSIQKKVKEISGKESNYIVQYLSQENGNKEFYNFKHLVGITEDSKYYYDLYLNKSFLKKLRKFFLDYKKREFVQRKSLFNKRGFGFYHFRKNYEEGFLLSKFTDPSLLLKIEEKLNEVFIKKLNKNQSVFSDLNLFHKLSIVKREELAILELALLLKKKLSYENKLNEIQYDLGFLQYVGEKTIISKETFLEKAKEFLNFSQKEIENKIYEIKSIEKKHFQKRKKLFKEYKLNAKEQKLFDINAEIAYLRLELRKLWLPYYCELSNSIDDLIKVNKIKNKRLETLRLKEFEDFLQTGKIPDNKRIHTILMFKEKNNIEIFYNKEAKKMAEIFELPLGVPQTNRLKGDIANKGFVKGKVKVLHWQKGYEKEMDKMKEGRILIVTQTKPDMLKAIRKASAIVTNEGGMISHAAIIARELGIPCLINTKYATEIFKDEDEVILDCESGEVSKK